MSKSIRCDQCRKEIQLAAEPTLFQQLQGETARQPEELKTWIRISSLHHDLICCSWKCVEQVAILSQTSEGIQL